MTSRAPGWYSDPSGRGGQAWWNGTSWGPSEYVPGGKVIDHQPANQRALTSAAPSQAAPTSNAGSNTSSDSFAVPSPTAAAVAAANPAAVASPHKAYASATSPSTAYSSAAMTETPSPHTWQAWAIIVLSLLPFVGSSYITATTAALDTSLLSSDEQFAIVTNPLYAVAMGSIWVVFIANFFLARSDGKQLASRGVPYPMPWGLIYFGALVFMIGRTANVKRYLGSGLSLFWATLAVHILGAAVIVWGAFTAISNFGSTLGPLGGGF